MPRDTAPPGAPDATAWEPRRPGLVALAIFAAAALTLCWPVLLGGFLPGSDQYLAGYAFRHFAAEYWREHHAIPLWNPYIFAGMPFVAGMHGDIFYPTAWLRWVLPTGTAMSLGFALHIVVAGVAMYALLRGLGRSWAGAVVGAVAYELSGIVVSQINPGHDGKLFVTALAPLLFLALLRGIRHRRVEAFGAAALVIGLSLHGHPQMSYYLLVAGGLWTLFLTFTDSEGPRGRQWWIPMGGALAAVALGLGIYAIQALPFYEYIPFSPRGGQGSSGGWEYATAYSMPPEELMSTVLPHFNGITDLYWGRNYFKLHTEYLGVLVVLLAIEGLAGAEERRLRWALGGIGLLFLLVASGAHTPFYRLWYETMPMMKKVRAAGMAYYLVALPVTVYAGFGADRLFRGLASRKRLLVGAGVLGAVGLLGASGMLQGVTEGFAPPERISLALENARALRVGSLRLLLFVLAGGGALLAVRAGYLRGVRAIAAVVLLVTLDLWSVDRRFVQVEGTPAQLFGDDAITRRIKEAPKPYRVWEPKGEQVGGLAVYPGSWLMGAGVPTLFGYHGNELHAFDALFGGKNVWPQQLNPVLWELFGIRFILLRQEQNLPRYHKVLTAATTTGGPGVLYEADTVPPYARLMAGAVKAPPDQIPVIVNDQRFPALAVAVYAESAPVNPTELGGRLPDPPAATASVSAWDAGNMHVSLQGRDARELYLVVAENWYKDWQATVDGRPVATLPAHGTLLSVPVPPGAREVVFTVRSASYARGRLISALSLAAIAALIVAPALRRRRTADG
ncbi:MAG: hypothetical protein ACRENB_15990 [Gemmatimonadales bacterium]